MMNVNKYVLNRVDRFSRPRRHDDEEPVRNGLSMSPSQMLQMVDLGVPVAASNSGMTFDEGYSHLDFDAPLEYTRGVDIGDLWEAKMDAKAKFRRLRDSGAFKDAVIVED